MVDVTRRFRSLRGPEHNSDVTPVDRERRALYKAVNANSPARRAQGASYLFPVWRNTSGRTSRLVGRTRLVLPSDLIELWQLTGGGDVFDSETIFRPTVPSSPNSCFVDDDIEGRNAAHAKEGKIGDLYVFQEGLFLSAVRLSDQRFVTLTNGGYAIKDSFGSLDEWYVSTLRAEYGERYGLLPSVSLTAEIMGYLSSRGFERNRDITPTTRSLRLN
jgi:hypothetical protein